MVPGADSREQFHWVFIKQTENVYKPVHTVCSVDVAPVPRPTATTRGSCVLGPLTSVSVRSLYPSYTKAVASRVSVPSATFVFHHILLLTYRDWDYIFAMFTPPPSPLPARQSEPATKPDTLLLHDQSQVPASTQAAKKAVGRSFRMTVILAPLLIIMITARIGYVSTRAVDTQVDIALSLPWHGIKDDLAWRHHRRQPEPVPQTQAQSQTQAQTTNPSSTDLPTATNGAPSPSPSSMTVPVSQQPIPTVPADPPTLPTPFPQSFDAGLAQNFSSISCSNFFANMTNSAPYRSCRPFSLLLQNSAAFINAQSNLTLMNSIVWGTCNTTVGLSQCEANMDWFAGALQTSCAQELSTGNAIASATLIGLQAFTVMYDVACQVDPTSNTYCYLDAVKNSNPADTYYYNLPLGIPVPQSATPTCSSCSKSIMGIYAAALQNTTDSSNLSGLKQTYQATAQLTNTVCGQNFVATRSSALPSLQPSWTIAGGLFLFVSLIIRAS